MVMNKEGKRSSSAIKNTLIIFGVAVTVFAIISIIWYFGYRIQYDKIASQLDASECTEDTEAKPSTIYSNCIRLSLTNTLSE